MDIYVGNLPYETDGDALRVAFTEFGEVSDQGNTILPKGTWVF